MLHSYQTRFQRHATRDDNCGISNDHVSHLYIFIGCVFVCPRFISCVQCCLRLIVESGEQFFILNSVEVRKGI